MADYRDIRDEIEEYGKTKDLRRHYKRKMMESIRRKHVSLFKSVLASGIDVNFADQKSNYPIHLAAALPPDKESREILETLVYSDADVNVTDRFGSTPLHLAVDVSLETTVSLLDFGCHVDAQDNAGCTALMKACRNSLADSLAIVQVLIDRRCNVLMKDEEGFTALHYICKNSKQEISVRNEIVYKLLYAGLSPCLQDHNGKIGLCHELDKFIHHGNSEIKEEELVVLRTLISCGRNINFTNKVYSIWLAYTLPLFSNVALLRLFEAMYPVLGLKFIRQLYKIYTELPSCDSRLAETLARYKDTPRSLKSSCRYVVRSQLKDRVLVLSDDLPLPTTLKKYLLLKEQ